MSGGCGRDKHSHSFEPPMSIVTTLAELAQPWADWFGDHKIAQRGVTWLHISGIMVAGGLAIASDRAALRVLNGTVDDRSRVLRDFSQVHRPILTGLAVVIGSGLLMMLADVEAILPSPVYLTKMGLFAALLFNGWLIQQNERQLALDPSPGNARWKRFKYSAVASIALWLLVALGGVTL